MWAVHTVEISEVSRHGLNVPALYFSELASFLTGGHDLTGDGRADLVVGLGSGAYAILSLRQTGALATPSPSPSEGAPIPSTSASPSTTTSVTPLPTPPGTPSNSPTPSASPTPGFGIVQAQLMHITDEIVTSNTRSGATLIGDIDGDGHVDIARSTGMSSTSKQGFVEIHFTNATGGINHTIVISDGLNGLPTGTVLARDEFGADVASIGDLDGDGVPDIVVGAPKDDDERDLETAERVADTRYDDDENRYKLADRGAFYVFFLRSNGTAKSFVKVSDVHGGLSDVLDL